MFKIVSGKVRFIEYGRYFPLKTHWSYVWEGRRFLIMEHWNTVTVYYSSLKNKIKNATNSDRPSITILCKLLMYWDDLIFYFLSIMHCLTLTKMSPPALWLLVFYFLFLACFVSHDIGDNKTNVIVLLFFLFKTDNIVYNVKEYYLTFH